MDNQTTPQRKLPKWLRTANFIYQIILILLGFMNTLLTSLDSVIHVPREYFECYAIIISLLPVLWSHILDASKQYIQTMTPIYSPESSLHEYKNILDNRQDINEHHEELFTLEQPIQPLEPQKHSSSSQQSPTSPETPSSLPESQSQS